MSKVKGFVLYDLRSTHAKYFVPRFNSFWDMVKTNLCHVRGTTCGDGTAWWTDWKKLCSPCPWECGAWDCLMFKLDHYLSYALGSKCAQYQVSSFISLWDMVKTNFYNVGGTTSGGGPTRYPDCSIWLPMSWGVTVLNIKSLALSSLWDMAISSEKYWKNVDNYILFIHTWSNFTKSFVNFWPTRWHHFSLMKYFSKIVVFKLKYLQKVSPLGPWG